MIDEKITKLAQTIVDYSVNVKKGERVIISASPKATSLVKEIYRLVLKKGGHPSVKMGVEGLSYIYYKNASTDQLKKFPEVFNYEVKKSQVYIGIGAPVNTREFSNVDPKKLAIRSKVTNSITDYIVNGKPDIRRVTMDYPSNALAQDAEMSLDEYENFLFDACLLDWPKLSKQYERIKKYMNKSKTFRVVAPGTDLRMEIYPKSFVKDDGKENMPGGEVFGAPVKKSVNGYISFTYPAVRDGVEVTGIKCEFKNGKCIKATATKNQDFLNKMLDTDAGSRYIGEIGIGMNPKITKFTKNLLFDEKIGGTVHFAFGMAYKECGAPNKSALHWDIVVDLRKGGKIIVDDKVVQKNGKWLI